MYYQKKLKNTSGLSRRGQPDVFNLQHGVNLMCSTYTPPYRVLAGLHLQFLDALPQRFHVRLGVGVQVDPSETRTLKGMYFQPVDNQVLSTQGQSDVNLHRLTLDLLAASACANLAEMMAVRRLSAKKAPNIRAPSTTSSDWSHDKGKTTMLQCASTGHVHTHTPLYCTGTLYTFNYTVSGPIRAPVVSSAHCTHSVIQCRPIRALVVHTALPNMTTRMKYAMEKKPPPSVTGCRDAEVDPSETPEL